MAQLGVPRTNSATFSGDQREMGPGGRGGGVGATMGGLGVGVGGGGGGGGRGRAAGVVTLVECDGRRLFATDVAGGVVVVLP